MKYVTASEIKRAHLVIATGNTYPHRAALKAMGGRWSNTEQGLDIHRAIRTTAAGAGQHVL